MESEKPNKISLQCSGEGYFHINLISESGGGVAHHLRVFEKSLPGINAVGAIFKAANREKSIVAIIPTEEIPQLIKFLQDAYDNAGQ